MSIRNFGCFPNCISDCASSWSLFTFYSYCDIVNSFYYIFVEKKKVDFATGSDGNEWVWVMGEHRDDKTIEQILEEEAHAKALVAAEREAEELR